MTAEAVAAFAERLKADEAFQSRLAGAADRAERLALAKAEGFDLSADDIGAVKEALGVTLAAGAAAFLSRRKREEGETDHHDQRGG
jgi:predicted ribosomally synthesized peptide with nif11-like leader